MKTLATILLAAIAACGCLDVNLLDEMHLEDLPDANIENDGTDDSTDTDTQTPGDPPSTDPNDDEPPTILPPTCAPEERRENDVCIAEGPASASLRFSTDEPADIGIEAGEDNSEAVLSEIWSTEHHIIVAKLTSKTETTAQIDLMDVNGNSAEVAVDVMGIGGPQVAITEILADPFGPEPDQEFIEIVNLSFDSIDVSGWMIDDNCDYDGDLLPQGTVLAGGQVAVLVSLNYNTEDGSDPSPHPSALIISLDSSLCSNGLKNSEAESIELYDGVGSLISTYNGGAGDPSEGTSTVRIVAEAPDGDPLAFEKDQSGTSTPGIAPSIQ